MFYSSLQTLLCNITKNCARVREGFKPSDFRLPDRVLGKPPMKRGPLAGVTLDVEERKRRHFRSVELSYLTGRPSRRKLVELGLEDLIEDIY